MLNRGLENLGSSRKGDGFILFASSIHAVSYRDLTFIQERMILDDAGLQEIQQTLDTTEKVLSKKKGGGLIKREHVLAFRRCTYTGETHA